MMNLTPLAVALALFTLSGVQGLKDGSYVPFRLSFQALVGENEPKIDEKLYDALSTVGMVSITDIPGLATKDATLATLNDCSMKSEATAEHVFGDGTVRRTMATHCVPNGVQTISHGTELSSECKAFDEASLAFRQAVSQVTSAFAERLSSMLGQDMRKPLLSTNEGYSFATIRDVVESGEHLEHFHAYQNAIHESQDAKADSTIEWHVDQGMFLVFTPARWTDGSCVQDGFSIELEDGSKAQVHFSDEDELVILLGDGVNQYINPALESRSLRALPHALSMPSHQDELNRVWYGRMVLPPAHAIHPEHQTSFGELRRKMIAKEDEDVTMALGCSSDMKARQLEETTCEAGTIYCWHRCMSLGEQNLTETTCQDRALDLACVNPRSQLWTGLHGDYFPGCVDVATADNHTDVPPLPQSPRDEAVCSHEAFSAFQQAQRTAFDHEKVLQENVATFQWSTDMTTGEIKGNLIYNGFFGWMSVGFANEGGAKNGMHGAQIIMALPGDDFNAVDGLNLDGPTNIKNYVIDTDGAKSSFRHWVETAADIPEGSYAIEETTCFTALQFTATGFHGRSFNLTEGAVDTMLWAVNGDDYYVGYHNARGIFSATWASDKILLKGEEDLSENDHGDEGDAASDPTLVDSPENGSAAFFKDDKMAAWIMAGLAVVATLL